MIKLLAHRGLWDHATEQNSLKALISALEQGFGIETDIRDCSGSIVIAHDMPDESAPRLSELIAAYDELDTSATLALNIKADGLSKDLSGDMAQIDSSSYFVFDMSIPDTLPYLRANLPVFLRLSELENESSLLSEVQGIWLDELTRRWVTADILMSLTIHGKPICVVSSELHGRDDDGQWAVLREVQHEGQWLLCTDNPREAKEFFGSD